MARSTIHLGHGHEKEVFNFPEKPQLHSLQQIETDLSSLDSVRRTVYLEKRFTSH